VALNGVFETASVDLLSMPSTFQETLCEIIFGAIEKICPSIHVERSPLSVLHLQASVVPVHAYRPREILLAQLAGTSSLQAATVDNPEQLIDLITFGDENVRSIIVYVLYIRSHHVNALASSFCCRLHLHSCN
jgi:hypothetical protein